MPHRPDVAKQDPAEGSREIIDRELKRAGEAKEPGDSGAPGSAGRGPQPDRSKKER